ncbi:hypothetical protein Gogos_015624 [Gossypium gossypioides]|uniref:Uncharacterized protein n=1 Tax=Gossypium gossypioides TaxID=34282 RepID=A0A7J9C296_GOSGO|nr:hypothetical protein [Gossypium gossypioides]
MNNCGVGIGREGKIVLKKGPWTAAEDSVLVEYVRVVVKGIGMLCKRTQGWHVVGRAAGLDGLTI